MKDKPSNETQFVARIIGWFYLGKNQNDYAKANKQLSDLGIQDIQIVNENTIEISLSRPGLLIGRKGQNLEALQKVIKKKIVVKETWSWMDYLAVYDPVDFLE